MNFGTAYLDGSGIYGATPESADKLREFDGGFLKVFKALILYSLHYCQARVQVPNPLSQKAPNSDPKVRPSLKNPKTQFFGLG